MIWYDIHFLCVFLAFEFSNSSNSFNGEDEAKADLDLFKADEINSDDEASNVNVDWEYEDKSNGEDSEIDKAEQVAALTGAIEGAKVGAESAVETIKQISHSKNMAALVKAAAIDGAKIGAEKGAERAYEAVVQAIGNRTEGEFKNGKTVKGIKENLIDGAEVGAIKGAEI